MDSYEKKYNDALERAKDFKEGVIRHELEIGENIMDYIFPELIKSENEKIRKELIAFIKKHNRSGCDYDYNKWIAWLEKQGEQNLGNSTKTCKIETLMTLDEAIEHCKEKSCDDTACGKEHSQLAEWLTELKYYRGSVVKEAQKPIDNIESKFKVGDWIINHNVIYHIDKMTQLYGENSGVYVTLSTIDGKTLVYPISVLDSEYTRLWTIQDAKDGDVLARNNDVKSICIFAHFDGINKEEESFLCHCGLEGEGLGQELSINGYHDDSNGYVPATKEQRDHLFAKMEEAGYEWDAEKKELKKVEQKHAWSEEDKRKLNRIYSILGEAADKHAFSTSCRLIGDKECIELQDFLKSIVRQNTWKPSDEQMIALRQAISGCSYDIEPLLELETKLKELISNLQ